MKLITRNTDYAIRALCFISKEKEKRVSASLLVKNLNIPRPFLRRILQLLEKEGILSSYKGIGGGFTLLKKPDSISVIDLIGIFQGQFRLNECSLNKKRCPNERICGLREKISALECDVARVLKGITIASIIKKEKVWQREK